MSNDRDSSSGETSGGSGGASPPPEQPIEEPPPYNPDPDLITFLEREVKPGEVKVWNPRND